MNEAITAVLTALRRAVIDGTPPGAVEVVRRADGALDHVVVTLDPPLCTEDLEGLWGRAEELPPHLDHPRRLLFPDTVPDDEEEVGCTVLADLDPTGTAVHRILLRQD